MTAASLAGVGMALGVVMNVLAVLYMAALATGGAFQAAAGIPDVSWHTPPYVEIGIASLIALVVLLPGLRWEVVRPRTGRLPGSLR